MSFVPATPEFIQSVQNVTAESLASYAGVINAGAGEDYHILKGQLALLQMKPKNDQYRVYHEVAAKYLPAIVERFRQSQGSLNPAMSLLNVITFTPYFSRFVRLPTSAGIGPLQMSRMANDVNKLDSYSPNEIAEIGQFLSTILVLQGNEGIGKQETKTLSAKFNLWTQKYPGRLAGEVGQRCIMMLSNDPEANNMRNMIKRQMGGSLDACGGPGCRNIRDNGAQLMQCSTCGTAAYCSPQHQKADWPTHKRLCFKSSF